jgi:hypothetical protein
LIGLGAAIVILLSILAFFILRRWRRRGDLPVKMAEPSQVPPVDPWTLLDQRWLALKRPEPWTREASEEFFFQLSFVLRQALELRTGLLITGQTLAETKQTLQKSAALSANFQQELLKFLSLAEQLKFAGQILDWDKAEAWQLQVEAWITQIRHGALI